MPKVIAYKLLTKDKRFGLIIYNNCLIDMFRYFLQAYPNETGGVCVGYYSPDHRYAVIRTVSGPSRDSRATPVALVQGKEGHQEWLDEMKETHGWYYLGEWHTHPNGLPEPSGTDISQMTAISRNTEYSCPEPVLLILAGTPPSLFQLQAFVFLPNDNFYRFNVVTFSDLTQNMLLLKK